MALIAQGYTVGNRQNPRARQTLNEEILAIGHELNNNHIRGHALFELSHVDQLLGHDERASERFLQGYTCFQMHGESVMHVTALLMLGRAHFEQGNYESAQHYLSCSLAYAEELNDKIRGSKVLLVWGYLALARGEPAAAGNYFAHAHAFVRKTGHKHTLVRILHGRGRAAQWHGNYPLAHALYHESLTIISELEHQPEIPLLLQAFACLAAAEGQAVRAAILFGTMDAYVTTSETLEELRYLQNDPNLHAEHDRLVALARAELGEMAFAAAWAKGAAMTQKEAINYALNVNQ